MRRMMIVMAATALALVGLTGCASSESVHVHRQHGRGGRHEPITKVHKHGHPPTQAQEARSGARRDED